MFLRCEYGILCCSDQLLDISFPSSYKTGLCCLSFVSSESLVIIDISLFYRIITLIELVLKLKMLLKVYPPGLFKTVWGCELSGDDWRRYPDNRHI